MADKEIDLMFRENTALIIIDVQIGAFDGKKISPIENADEFLGTLNGLISSFREANLPIVYIQDCGKAGGAFEKDSEHWPIHPQIQPKENDIVIQKTSGNAFVGTNLKERLKSLDVSRIVLTGLHSEKCVTETFLQAKKDGLEVIVPQNGHTTISSKEESFRDKIYRQNNFFEENGASRIVDIER